MLSKRALARSNWRIYKLVPGLPTCVNKSRLPTQIASLTIWLELGHVVISD